MTPAQAACAAAGPPPLRANSGGPASRTRRARISSSLLGDGPGRVCCGRVCRLGLDFGPTDPVEWVTGLLRACGAAGPEALRAAFPLPAGRLIAAPQAEPAARLDARAAPPREVLEQALLLGLCTSDLFDPARPVLWTTRSLTRALELFEPAGFYA